VENSATLVRKWQLYMRPAAMALVMLNHHGENMSRMMGGGGAHFQSVHMKEKQRLDQTVAEFRSDTSDQARHRRAGRRCGASTAV